MDDTLVKEAAALERRTIKIVDVEIEYWEGGEGQTLLYLHNGQGFDPASRFVNLLARHFRVVAPSHPGFGTSSFPMWMDSVDDLAHIHLDLMERLDLRNVILVGASIGSWIAAEIATMNLTRIEKIVLVGPVGVKIGSRNKLDVPDIFALSEEKLAALVYHDPAMAQFDPAAMSDEELTVMVRNKQTLALVTWEPYMHNPKLKHRLHRIDKPTLVLRGESDGIVEDWYAKAFVDLLPSARLESVSEAGHLPHIEQPDVFVRRLVEFAE